MSLTPASEALAGALASVFETGIPDKIGVAVSGGGDSMALLDLLRGWGQAELCVASVDHGLRSEARDEVALVADYAARHGINHSILHWQWDRQGNLQQSARDGRRALLTDWAQSKGLKFVALGHTADDQAETFLMRLARGSGVDGLSAMGEARKEGALTWLRPLLNVRREALREHLREAGLVWADDPSNEDPKFDRVKARQALGTLATLGLSVDRLTQTAAHMQEQRVLADWAAEKAAQDVVSQDVGDVLLDLAGFSALPDALKTRLLADALVSVSGNDYRPRYKSLLDAMKSETAKPLHGCLVIPHKGHMRITREWAAVKDLRTAVADVWDGRWNFQAPKEAETDGLHVAALGEMGLAQIEDWRACGRPRPALLSSPAVWDGDKLVAAPLAGYANGWDVQVLAS